MTIIFSEQFVPNEDQTSQDIFLLLDEVPCNSDPGFEHVFYGRPSGDWKGLKTNGVNLMMVLKPIENSVFKGTFSCLLDKIMQRNKSIHLCFPENIAHLQLSRIYRCTKNIAEFYEELVTSINKPSLIKENQGINSSSISYSPGHEIHGDHPEVLLLPRCNCFGDCKNPVEHFLQANKTKILAMLKRIQSKFSISEITVLIDSTSKKQKCVNWLKTELIKENSTIDNIVFKTIGQCRGLEFPVLLSISDSCSVVTISTTLDAWTRVTASLFIIQMENKYSTMTQGLKACLKKQIAKQAEEHEEINYNLLKKIYFFLRSPLVAIIIMPLLAYVLTFWLLYFIFY